jgi:ferric-dicitrate binding protein FerR (iron transport regulator)
MTSDKRLDDYLWHAGGDPDPDAAALEGRLSALRFDPAAHPLALPSHAPSRRRSLVRLAAAAAIVAIAGAGAWTWRLSWPAGRAWTLHSSSTAAPLEVGRIVTLPPAGGAVANVARIGRMRLDGGTSVELRSTTGRRHRLRMTDGRMHVRVWAPPASVVIETPAGEVIDMGCEFVLSVDDDTSVVQVLSGWVQLENGIDEVLVPAGASTAMTAGRSPGVPVFDDAADEFRRGVRALEGGDGGDAIAPIVARARHRDVYTLLQLADRYRFAADRLLRRAAELSPPPDGITIASILRGNREHLWMWANAQPLPPPKSGWWRYWRDALPFWLTER